MPACSILTTCKWQQRELCPPPSLTCLKHDPEGMCFRCRMLGRAQALQQNDSIWCTLHFFPRCLTNSSCVSKREKLNNVAAQDSSYQTPSDSLCQSGISTWLPAKRKKRGRKNEGVESERKMWTIWIAICSACILLIFC